MATLPRKPSPPASRPTPQAAGDPLAAVVEQLEFLRRDVAALRDEVRGLRQRPARRPRARPGSDPGDAVPPGVAVQDPAPLTAADRKAKRNLERLPRR